MPLLLEDQILDYGRTGAEMAGAAINDQIDKQEAKERKDADDYARQA